MKDKIISMLENDARLTAAQIAAALGSERKNSFGNDRRT